MIEGLCAACDASPFEPHVTVYSADLPDLDLLKQAVIGAVAEIGPFFLRTAGIGCSEEYFKSLYVAFRDSALLRGIHERLKVGLGEDSGYRLVPHLSLLYSDIPLGKKEELARRMVLERDEILFDRVKVVSPGNVREGWRDVMEWRTLFSVRLGGAS